MGATLKSELRKLLSVRSTYVIAALTLLLISIMSFYVEGYWGKSGSAAGQVTNLALREITTNTLSSVTIFIAIIVILQVVHEYRHSTIMYTLTSSNSRTKALLAKVFVLTGFAVVFSLVGLIFSLAVYMLGITLRDVSLPIQTINWLDVVGKGLFYNVAYASIGLIIAYVSRNIAAAIAFVLITPTTVEPLLGILLKDKAVYLPFAALDKVVAIEGSPSLVQGQLSFSTALTVSLVYLAIGWLVTWQLFIRRDAN